MQDNDHLTIIMTYFLTLEYYSWMTLLLSIGCCHHWVAIKSVLRKKTVLFLGWYCTCPTGTVVVPVFARALRPWTVNLRRHVKVKKSEDKTARWRRSRKKPWMLLLGQGWVDFSLVSASRRVANLYVQHVPMGQIWVFLRCSWEAPCWTGGLEFILTGVFFLHCLYYW